MANGTGSAGYWLRVILGALDDGLVAAGGVFLGSGISADAPPGQLALPLKKENIGLALMVGAYVMFKNVRAYLKVPMAPPLEPNVSAPPPVRVP
jgi:hypothetical protein